MARNNLKKDVGEVRNRIKQLRSLQVPEIADPTQYGREALQADLRAVRQQLLEAFPQLTELVRVLQPYILLHIQSSHGINLQVEELKITVAEGDLEEMPTVEVSQ